MEGKGSSFNIILLLILAFLSLTLAALAGFVFIGGGTAKSPSTNVVQPIDTSIPADKDLASFPLYEDKALLNLKNADPNSTATPIVQLTAELSYFKKPKNSSIKNPLTKLELYKSEISALMGTYFMNMTKNDAMMPEAREKASEELTKKINDLINTTEKEKGRVVYKVVFSYWFVA